MYAIILKRIGIILRKLRVKIIPLQQYQHFQ
jgi:hypothetical protein